MSRYFLLLVVGVALNVSLFAQGARPNAEAPAATLQFMALVASPVLTELHQMRGPNEGAPISVPIGRLSRESYPAPAAGPVVLAVKRSDAQGKPVFIPVAQVAWPAGAEKAIVFVAVTGSGPDTKVQAMVVDNSLKVFPARSVRVMNFSGRPLLGQFGDFRGEIAPGAGRAVAYPGVKIPEGGSVGRFPVAIGMNNEQGQPSVLFKGFTEAWPQARTLIVVTPPVGEKAARPQVRFVLDVLPGPAAAEKRVSAFQTR